MTSQRQIDANRKNSEKSTGPITPLGKEQSRKNAITHGLTAKILIAEDVEALVVARLEAFSASLPAESELDQWYLQQAAMESVRIEQAQAIEQTMRVEKAERAATCWHQDRASDAADLFERIGKKPEKTVRALETTRHGCDRLIAQWELLACLPRNGQAWNAEPREMVLDLLGVSLEARLIRDHCPHTPDEQLALAESEITRLQTRRAESLDALDESRREGTMRGIILPDRDIKLVRRYEAMSRRVFDAAIKHLKSKVNGPVASKPAKKPIADVIASEIPAPIDRRTADIESLEVLVNELRAMEARAGSTLVPSELADEMKAQPIGATEPDRPTGNRKARRAAEAAKRNQRR